MKRDIQVISLVCILLSYMITASEKPKTRSDMSINTRASDVFEMDDLASRIAELYSLQSHDEKGLIAAEEWANYLKARSSLALLHYRQSRALSEKLYFPITSFASVYVSIICTFEQQFFAKSAALCKAFLAHFPALATTDDLFSTIDPKKAEAIATETSLIAKAFELLLHLPEEQKEERQLTKRNKAQPSKKNNPCRSLHALVENCAAQ